MEILLLKNTHIGRKFKENPPYYLNKLLYPFIVNWFWNEISLPNVSLLHIVIEISLPDVSLLYIVQNTLQNVGSATFVARSKSRGSSEQK